VNLVALESPSRLNHAYPRHPAVDSAKLRMYSAIGTGEETSVGEAIRSPKCGLTFAVVFLTSDDLGNKGYRARLKTLIRDNCNRGKHQDEYFIDDTR
jgi:hypothetical protein